MGKKMAPKSVSPAEKQFVTQMYKETGEPEHVEWFLKRKRDKVQDRLIVLTNYRMSSFKKTFTGKLEKKREGHLLDIVELNSPDVDRLIVKFKDFAIDITRDGAGTSFLLLLRKVIQKMTFAFADYALPKIVLFPVERELVTLEQIEPGPANGLLATYYGYCDYYRLKPSAEFEKYIKDLVATGSRELNLTQCPGIDRVKKDESFINFLPIKAALQHNTYFDCLSIKSVPRKDIASLFGDIFLHNITIQRLRSTGVFGSEDAWVNLGNSLSRNQHHALVEIDLSQNPMKDKGAIGLSVGLRSMSHSLSRLSVASCAIGSKGISALVQALTYGPEVSRGLSEFDISNNKAGEEGSKHLATWISQGMCPNLKYLLLHRAGVNVAVVMKGIKTGAITTLEEIVISGNKIDQQGGQAISSLIESLPSLKLLDCSYCSLQAASASQILTATAANTTIKGTSVNLSHNELGPVGAQKIAQVIASCDNIDGLLVASCGFKKDGIRTILHSLGQNTSLKILDLSLNFSSGSAKKMSQVVVAMAEAITKHPSLQHLSIAGNGENKAIGKEITPLLKALSKNPVLEELNISGNKIGDQLALTLVDSLRENTNLRSLVWDRNGINIGGWQGLLNALPQCPSLVHNPLPKADIEKATKESKDKLRFKDRVNECYKAIHETMKKNNGGQDYTPVVDKVTPRVYTEIDFSNDLGLSFEHSGGTLRPHGNQASDPPPDFNNNNSYNSYDSNPPPALQAPPQMEAPPMLSIPEAPPAPPISGFGAPSSSSLPPPTQDNWDAPPPEQSWDAPPPEQSWDAPPEEEWGEEETWDAPPPEEGWDAPPEEEYQGW